MQSKLEVLTMRVNEVEERVSDLEDKLMARKEAEEKRKTKDHEERLREMIGSEGKIYVELGFQRVLRGPEGQKAYMNKA